MTNPQPVAEVRIGRVKAAIWQNETEGRTRHTVTFSRLYKDGERSAGITSRGSRCGLIRSRRQRPPECPRPSTTRSPISRRTLRGRSA